MAFNSADCETRHRALWKVLGSAFSVASVMVAIFGGSAWMQYNVSVRADEKATRVSTELQVEVAHTTEFRDSVKTDIKGMRDCLQHMSEKQELMHNELLLLVHISKQDKASPKQP
jgi:hypothetical protein